MSIITIPKRTGVSVKLNGGVNPETGKDVTRSVALSGVKTGADNAKIWTIVNLLEPCLAYSVIRVERTEVVSLEDDGDD